MEYKLFTKILIEESRWKQRIYYHLHRQSILQVQACYYDIKENKFTDEIETSYPIERIKKYHQIRSVKWMLKHKYHQLLKYRLKRIDNQLEEELIVRSIGKYVSKVKDKELLDTLYLRYREYFEDQQFLVNAVTNDNLYLLNILLNQQIPCSFTVPKDLLQTAISNGASNELLERILSLPDVKYQTMDVFVVKKILALPKVEDKQRLSSLLFHSIISRVNHSNDLSSLDAKILCYLSKKEYDVAMVDHYCNDRLLQNSRSIRLYSSLIDKDIYHFNLDELYYKLLHTLEHYHCHPKTPDLVIRRTMERFKLEGNINQVSVFYVRVFEILKMMNDQSLMLNFNTMVSTLILENPNSLDMISYLLDYETRAYMPIEESVFDLVCQHGTLEQVKHAHGIIGVDSKKCVGRATYRAMDFAAQRGDLEIVKFLHLERNEQCSQDIFNYIKSKDVAEYLIEAKPVLRKYLRLQQALESLDLSILKYIDGLEKISSKEIVFSRMIIEKLFATKHNLDIIEYIDYLHHNHYLNLESYYHLFCEASRLGNMDLIQYLDSIIKIDIPTPPQFIENIIDVAYLNGHYDVATYLTTSRKLTFTEISFRICGKIGVFTIDFDLLDKTCVGVTQPILTGWLDKLKIEALKYYNYKLCHQFGIPINTIPPHLIRFNLKMGEVFPLKAYLSNPGLASIDMNELEVLFEECMLSGLLDGGDLVIKYMQHAYKKEFTLSAKRIHHIITKGSIRVINYLIQNGIITKELVESYEFTFIHHPLSHQLEELFISKEFVVDKSSYPPPFINYNDENKLHSYQTLFMYPRYPPDTAPISEVFSNKVLLSLILAKTRRVICDHSIPYYLFKTNQPDKQNLLRDKLFNGNVAMTKKYFDGILFQQFDNQVVDFMVTNYAYFLSDDEYDLKDAQLNVFKRLLKRNVYTDAHLLLYTSTMEEINHPDILHFIHYKYPHIQMNLVNVVRHSGKSLKFMGKYFPNGIHEPIPIEKDAIYHSVLDNFYNYNVGIGYDFKSWKFVMDSRDPHGLRVLDANTKVYYWYMIHNHLDYAKGLDEYKSPTWESAKYARWTHLIGGYFKFNNSCKGRLVKYYAHASSHAILPDEINWNSPLYTIKHILKLYYEEVAPPPSLRAPLTPHHAKFYHYNYNVELLLIYNIGLEPVPESMQEEYLRFVISLGVWNTAQNLSWINRNVYYTMYHWCKTKGLTINTHNASLDHGYQTNKLLKDLVRDHILDWKDDTTFQFTNMSNEYIQLIVDSLKSTVPSFRRMKTITRYVLGNVINQNDPVLFQQVIRSHLPFDTYNPGDIDMSEERRYFYTFITNPNVNLWNAIHDHLKQHRSSILREILVMAGEFSIRYIAEQAKDDQWMTDVIIRSALSSFNIGMLNYLIKLHDAGIDRIHDYLMATRAINKTTPSQPLDIVYKPWSINLNLVSPKILQFYITFLPELFITDIFRECIINHRADLVEVICRMIRPNTGFGNQFDIRGSNPYEIDVLCKYHILDECDLRNYLYMLQFQQPNTSSPRVHSPINNNEPPRINHKLIHHIRMKLLKRKKQM